MAGKGWYRPIPAYSILFQSIPAFPVYCNLFQPIPAYSPIPNLQSPISNLECPIVHFIPDWICPALWPGLLKRCTQHTAHYTLNPTQYTLHTAHCTLQTLDTAGSLERGMQPQSDEQESWQLGLQMQEVDAPSYHVMSFLPSLSP